MKKIEYDPFVSRQFSQNFSGTKVEPEAKEALLIEINKAFEFSELQSSEWDFCKYLAIPNTFGVKCATREITLDIYPYIRTDYVQRTPDELPVLTRFAQLPPGFKQQQSEHIVLVLYSRAQLESEFKPKDDGQEFYFDDSVEWGIVSIMGTMEPRPDPLVPITIMRNALGVEEGGNGERISRASYSDSVEFWSRYILVK